MPEHILAVLVDDASAEVALRAAYLAAFALAERHVVAFHVVIDPDSETVSPEQSVTESRRRELEAFEMDSGEPVQAAYSRIAGELGAGRFEWCHIIGRESTEITRLTASARLLVMQMRSAHASGNVRDALRAALLDSDCPMLIVPSSYRARAIEHVTIAWSDHGSCGRCVKAAEPWLRQARQITVARIGKSSNMPVEIEGLLGSMRVTAAFRALEPSDEGEEEQLLAAASDADWVIMGGYGGRVVEWLLGGRPEAVFNKAKVPVFTMD